MDAKTHWERVYATRASDSVSWYRKHLEKSLTLIERAAESRSASIIDVGGGESTLVDDLLFFVDTRLSPMWIFRRPQLKRRKSDWALLRSKFAG